MKRIIIVFGVLALGVGVTRAQKAENKPAPAAKTAAKPAKGTGQVILTSRGGQHDDGRGVTKLTGSVVVRQEGEAFVLRADSVTYNRDANQAVATGNLVVETKDSTITGMSLRADFDTKHIYIRDNVEMNSHGKTDGMKKTTSRGPGDTVGDITHKPSKMLCNTIDYNYEISEALVTGNIRMKQENSSGTCRQIVFDEENNVAELSGDVSFTDKKQQTFQVEKLIVWFDSDKLDFQGPVTMRGRNDDDPKAADPKKPAPARQTKKNFGGPPVVPDLEKEPVDEKTPDKPAETKPAEPPTVKPASDAPVEKPK